MPGGKKIIILLCLFICGAKLFAQAPGHVIEEKQTGAFKLSVYLPPGYDSAKQYKVLYFNDGQTIFGETGLRVEATANELIGKNLMEPVIIVGIHSDENRTGNYLPYKDRGVSTDFGAYTPNAAGYSAKIINQIIPFIEKLYKTNVKRGIAGYSFGGLHATWMALNHPEYFSFSGSLSPSYWVNDFKIFDEAHKARPEQTHYFDMGTGEWNYIVPMLLHIKLPILQKVFYYEDFGGRHIIDDWRGTRIRNILLLFSGNTNLTAYTWEINKQVIKSAATGKFYLRINPVITYSNGLTCSAGYAATFTLLNPDDGVVNTDGSFRFTNPKNLKVKVVIYEEEKEITIDYNEVEKIKSLLGG